METLEHLRGQIKTTDDLKGVVRTMKALAAVGIHQNERAVHALRVYARAVELGLQVMFRNDPGLSALRGAHGRVEAEAVDSRPLGLVVFGSDHGLCGRFNDEIVAHVVERLGSIPGARPRILAVGARTGMRLEQAGLGLEQTLLVPGTASHITPVVRRILQRLDDWRSQGTRQVMLAYNQHLSGARYSSVWQRLTPLDTTALAGLRNAPWPSKVLPTYSMPRDELLQALLRQYIFINVFRACAESLASESGARLAAMHAAGRNLEERHNELSALFRRLRQTMITAELLDVVNGYEALLEQSVNAEAPGGSDMCDLEEVPGR
ncbi:MAG: F0F1 ATP synthase subunit gamma [Gammaproteobacteria bacterium]|nr:F0F1 ATP synthase subunit gamma [Gammaproteobacteria bacterium]